MRLVGEIGIGAAAAAVVPVRWAGPFGPVAVVVVVVVLINATNMLDGLDALASGVAMIGAAGFAVVLGGDGRTVALALAGALAGFLWFNRPPARIYLGDAGSYLVGTALALLLATAWSPHRAAAVGIAGIALVALPVIEAGVTIIRRLRAAPAVPRRPRPRLRPARRPRVDADPGEPRVRARRARARGVADRGRTHTSTTAAAGDRRPRRSRPLLAVLVGAGFTRPEFRREVS